MHNAHSQEIYYFLMITLFGTRFVTTHERGSNG